MRQACDDMHWVLTGERRTPGQGQHLRHPQALPTMWPPALPPPALPPHHGMMLAACTLQVSPARPPPAMPPPAMPPRAPWMPGAHPPPAV
eukprot:6003418-Prymnesium_polylepis.1